MRPNESSNSLPFNLRPGNKQQAHYCVDTSIPQYQHNPCILSLPSILNPIDAAKLFASNPALPDPLAKDPAKRMHQLEAALQCWYEPTSGTVDLSHAIELQMRAGYLARNPVSTSYHTDREYELQRLQSGSAPLNSRSANLTTRFVGASGMGKTTALETVLKRYPQVIYHQEFQGRPFHFTQLVWIHMDCPFDGSPRGLCLSFFAIVDGILGTAYYDTYSKGRPNTDQLLMAMGRVVRNHALGLLVIDEINVLRDIKTEGATKLLNFFVQMVNTLGVPIMLVGTCRASNLFQKAFRQARRGTGQEAQTWLPFTQNDPNWQQLFESLSKYQVMDVPVTNPNDLAKLRDVLHLESVGIIDIAVKLWKLAQWRGLSHNHKSVSVKLIRSVAKDSLGEVRNLLAAFRKGCQDVDGLEDIQIIDEATFLSSMKDSKEQTLFRAFIELLRQGKYQPEMRTDSSSTKPESVKDGAVSNDQQSSSGSSSTSQEKPTESETQLHEPLLKDILSESACNGQSLLHKLRDQGVSPLSDERSGAEC